MDNPLEAQKNVYGEVGGPPMLFTAEPSAKYLDQPSWNPLRRREKRMKVENSGQPEKKSTLDQFTLLQNLYPEIRTRKDAIKNGTIELSPCQLPGDFPPELAYRALAVYSLLRTLSIPLRLSPFTPNVFLRAMYMPFPNKLLGEIHVALLRILLPHLKMGYSYKDTGGGVGVCKRRHIDNIRWPLRGGDNLTFLDTFSWPLFYDDYCHLTADRLWESWHGGAEDITASSRFIDFRRLGIADHDFDLDYGDRNPLETGTEFSRNLSKKNYLDIQESLFDNDDNGQSVRPSSPRNRKKRGRPPKSQEEANIEEQSKCDDDFVGDSDFEEYQKGQVADSGDDDDNWDSPSRRRNCRKSHNKNSTPKLTQSLSVRPSKFAKVLSLKYAECGTVSQTKSLIENKGTAVEPEIIRYGNGGSEDAASHRLYQNNLLESPTRNPLLCDQAGTSSQQARLFLSCGNMIHPDRSTCMLQAMTGVFHQMRYPSMHQQLLSRQVAHVETPIGPTIKPTILACENEFTGITKPMQPDAMSGKQSSQHSKSEDSLVVPDRIAKLLHDFVRGNDSGVHAQQVNSTMIPNDNNQEEDEELEDNIFTKELEESLWKHFKPLHRIRAGIPYYLLKLEEKLDIIEFLVDELLSMEAFSSLFADRLESTCSYDRPYGSSPSQKEYDELQNEDECAVCYKEGDLLCCDGCIHSYHRECLGMNPEQDLGDGKWLCPECLLVDPSQYRPLDGGKKSSLDWFQVRDLQASLQKSDDSGAATPENVSCLPIKEKLSPCIDQATSTNGKQVPEHNYPGKSSRNLEGIDTLEFLAVHGFVFAREISIVAQNDDTSFSRGWKTYLPLSKAELDKLLETLGFEFCRSWPFSQIPCSIWPAIDTSRLPIEYFRNPASTDPCWYKNKYQRAPNTFRAKTGGIHEIGRLQKLGFEVQCQRPNYHRISDVLTKDMSLDDKIKASLTASSVLFDPLQLITGYMLGLESLLRRACIIDFPWDAEGCANRGDKWVSCVKKAKSIPSLARLLLRLVNEINPRAFADSWFHNPHMKPFDPDSYVSEQTFRVLPQNWDIEREKTAFRWRTTPPSLILKLCKADDFKPFASRGDLPIRRAFNTVSSKRKIKQHEAVKKRTLALYSLKTQVEEKLSNTTVKAIARRRDACGTSPTTTTTHGIERHLHTSSKVLEVAIRESEMKSFHEENLYNTQDASSRSPMDSTTDADSSIRWNKVSERIIAQNTFPRLEDISPRNGNPQNCEENETKSQFSERKAGNERSLDGSGVPSVEKRKRGMHNQKARTSSLEKIPHLQDKALGQMPGRKKLCPNNSNFAYCDQREESTADSSQNHDHNQGQATLMMDSVNLDMYSPGAERDQESMERKTGEIALETSKQTLEDKALIELNSTKPERNECNCVNEVIEDTRKSQTSKISSRKVVKKSKKRKNPPGKTILPLRRNVRRSGRLDSTARIGSSPSTERCSDGIHTAALPDEFDGMQLQIENSKKRKIADLEKLAKQQSVANEIWPIAGKLVFPTVGDLPPRETRRIGRNAGVAIGANLAYHTSHEVAQVCYGHIWRKRVAKCFEFEELLLLIRVLESCLDHQSIYSCESASKRGKAASQKEICCSMKNSSSGDLYHFVVNKKTHKGCWMANSLVDVSSLVCHVYRLRQAVIKTRLERARLKQEADKELEKLEKAKRLAEAKKREQEIRQKAKKVEAERIAVLKTIRDEQKKKAQEEANKRTMLIAEQRLKQAKLALGTGLNARQQQAKPIHIASNSALQNELSQLHNSINIALSLHGDKMFRLLKECIGCGITKVPDSEVIALRKGTMAYLKKIADHLRQRNAASLSEKRLLKLVFEREKLAAKNVCPGNQHFLNSQCVYNFPCPKSLGTSSLETSRNQSIPGRSWQQSLHGTLSLVPSNTASVPNKWSNTNGLDHTSRKDECGRANNLVHQPTGTQPNGPVCLQHLSLSHVVGGMPSPLVGTPMTFIKSSTKAENSDCWECSASDAPINCPSAKLIASNQFVLSQASHWDTGRFSMDLEPEPIKEFNQSTPGQSAASSARSQEQRATPLQERSFDIHYRYNDYLQRPQQHLQESPSTETQEISSTFSPRESQYRQTTQFTKLSSFQFVNETSKKLQPPSKHNNCPLQSSSHPPSNKSRNPVGIGSCESNSASSRARRGWPVVPYPSEQFLFLQQQQQRLLQQKQQIQLELSELQQQHYKDFQQRQRFPQTSTRSTTQPWHSQLLSQVGGQSFQLPGFPSPIGLRSQHNNMLLQQQQQQAEQQQRLPTSSRCPLRQEDGNGRSSVR